MKKILLAIIFLMVFAGLDVKAANVGDIVNFNVDQNYDATDRSKVQAVLIRNTSNLYFYIEKSWWDVQTPAKQNEILTNLDILSIEFNDKIYPTLTNLYGFEAKPGIDGDNKITILFQLMNNNLGGYFRSTDQYFKLQTPNSNEREMLYLPIGRIDNPQLKVSLAHEFTHLIAFNQKDKMYGVSEEVWLNEARADYTSTILGYNDPYQGSNLQKRINDFLEQPGDSLAEWQNTKHDYGVTSLFIHYLVDHYGINILSNSLHSKLIGIPSINEALVKAGVREDFSKIFTNWTISVIINSCSADAKYCYKDKNLTSLKINPNLIFLPLTGSSSLSITNNAKNWAGSWQKIIGGSGDLKMEFSTSGGLVFQVPYIIYDKNNNYTVNFLNINKQSKGEINIKNFGSQYNSLVIMPSLQTKISGFDGLEYSYPYTFTISITGVNDASQENFAVIQKLLDQIDALKKQIAALQGQNPSQTLCDSITSNLSLGLSGSQVSCLQQFLKMQGQDIYPQGLVTGYFGSLTRAAVVLFQEKYKNEILVPVGLFSGTGFVGLRTREKINQLLHGR